LALRVPKSDSFFLAEEKNDLMDNFSSSYFFLRKSRVFPKDLYLFKVLMSILGKVKSKFASFSNADIRLSKNLSTPLFINSLASFLMFFTTDRFDIILTSPATPFIRLITPF